MKQIKNWLREKTSDVIDKINIYEIIKIIILIVSLVISIRNDNPNSKSGSGSLHEFSIKDDSIAVYDVVMEVDIVGHVLLSGQALIRSCTDNKEAFFDEKLCNSKCKIFLAESKGLKKMKMYVMVIIVFSECDTYEGQPSTLEPLEFIPMQSFNQVILNDNEPNAVCGVGLRTIIIQAGKSESFVTGFPSCGAFTRAGFPALRSIFFLYLVSSFEIKPCWQSPCSYLLNNHKLLTTPITIDRQAPDYSRMKESKEGSDWFFLFKQGDKDAFRQVFEEHYRSILYFASSILQEDSFAEDLVSETFRKAWENRKNFQTGRHLENFLFFVTRNACISCLRSGRTAQSTEQEWVRLTRGMDDEDVDIDLERVQTRLIELLYTHLANLKGGEVLRMSYLEGKSTQEIAEKLNISENSVYLIKSRSLRQLRDLLNSDALLLLFLLFFGDFH